MDDFIRHLLSTEGFVPRRTCGLWSGGHIWLHTASDLAIWLAYLSIPIILLFFLWSRRAALPFRGLIALFAAFILCCGTTHLLDALMFDWPAYRLAGVMKGVTAAVSWLTVAALVPAVPQVLRFLDDTVPAAGGGPDTAVALGRPQRYMLAAGLSGLSLLGQFGLDVAVGEGRGFLLPLMAVMAAAGYGGFGPGMVAMLLGGAGYVALFIDFDSPANISNQSNAALFVFCGLLASTLGQAQRSARLAAEAATADLHESNRQLARSQWDTVEALTQLDAFLTHAPVGLAFYNPDLEPVRVNKYLSGMGNDANGRLAFPADTLAAFRQVLDTGAPLRNQTVNGLSGPNSVWQVGAFPARDTLGVSVGLAVVAQDVTERVNQERAVAASEARFRELADAMPQIVYVSDPAGSTQYLNRRWSEYTGQPVGEIGDTAGAVHPDDQPRIETEFAAAVAAGRPFTGELRLRSQDGDYRWFLTRSEPIRGEAGAVVRRYGTSTDIDDQKRAEDELRQAGALLRQITDTVPAFIALVGPDRRYQLVNRAYEEQFGRSREELIGRTVREVLGEAGWAASGPRLDRAFAGEVVTYEAELTAPDGAARSLVTTFTPKRDAAGGVQGVVVSAVDVTERKRAAAELTALTAESDRRRRLYEAVLNSTPDLAYVWGLDHRFTYANDSLLRMWGKTWDEAVGQNCLELGYEPWHAEMHGREIEQVRATRQPFRGEVPFTGTFGRRIYDYLLVPVVGPDGQVEAVAGTTRDVTDRKEYEERLRTSEADLSDAQRLAHVGNWRWDVRTDEVTGSDELYRIYGLDPAEPFPAFAAQDGLLYTHDAWLRVGEGISHTAATGEPCEFEVPAQAGGKPICVLVRCEAERDAGGAIRTLRGTVQDVTARRAAEERFAFVRRSSGVGFWYCDLPFDVLEWDERVKAHFHLPPDATVTIDIFYARIHPDDQEPTRRAIAQSIGEHAGYDTVYRTVHPDTGEVKWVRAVGRTAYGPDGTPTQFDGITIDVTAAKTAEAALRESELNARMALDVARLGTWRFYPADGRIEADARSREVMGYPPDGELALADSLDRTHPDDRAEVNAAVAAALDRPDGQFALEHRVVHRDGAERWVSGSGVVESADGSPVVIRGTVLDITERKAAEAALRDSEERYRALIDLSPQLVWAADPDGKATYYSRSWQDYTGLTIEQGSGDGWGNVVHPDDLAAVAEAWTASVAAGGEYQTECRLRRAADGAYRWHLNRARLVRDAAGIPAQWIGVALDIDDRRAAERALAASEARFRGLTDTAPQIVWEAAPDGRLTFLNQFFEEYSGRPAVDGLGDGDRGGSFIRPDQQQRVAAIWADAVKGAGRYEDLYPVRRADGVYRWFQARGRLVRHPDGTPDRWVGTSTDVHDRVEAEEALAATQRTLTLALATANAGVFTWDVAADRFALRLADPANPGTLALSRPQTYAQTMATIHPDDRERVRAAVERCRVDRGPFAETYRVGSPDAGWRWLEGRGQFEYAPDGTPLRMVGVRMDVHDRKTAEEAARRADREFRAMADSIPQLAWMTRPDGFIDWYNSRWYEYTGATYEQMQGWGWQAVHDPAEVGRVSEKFKYHIETGIPWEDTFPLKGADGVFRWFLSRARPIRDEDGKVVRWFGTNTDVTAQRQLEADLRAVGERFRFLDALGQATREADARATLATTARLLGEHLHATRCAYADVFADGDRFAIRYDWTDGAESTVGEYSLALFGSKAVADLNAGRPLVIRDVDAELTPADGADMFNAIGIKAIVCCPLVKGGSLVAMMAVHQSEPRDWTPAEVSLIAEVVERSWAHVERARAEDEAREAADRFRTLAESVPALVWSSDAAGHADYYSSRWTEYTGLPPAELVDDGWLGAVHPTDRPGRVAAAEEGVRVGRPFSAEYRLRRHDGTYRWHLSQARPQRDAGGQVVRWYGTVTDIDDQKALENELRQKSAILDTINNHTPTLVYVKDREGRVIMYNPATLAAVGKTDPAEVVGRDEIEFLPADAMAVIQAHDRQVMDGERVLTLEEQPDLRSDRTFLSIKAPHRGPDGQVVGLIGVSVDITAQKRLERELRTASDRFRTLTESIPQMVFNADAGGRVSYFNTRWQEYTGLAQPDALDHWWPQVIHPADAPALQSSWQRAVKDRAEPFGHEVRVRRASDGAYRWHLTDVVPLRNPAGGVDQWIGSLSDVHDLKTAEEAIRASEMRFRQLVEAVPNLVWVTDADGRITQLNRQWVGYTGRQLDDLLGDGWATLLHPDDAPGVLAGWQAAVRHRAPYAGEFRLRTADGSYRWQLARGIPVAGADGRLSQWFGTTTDIDNQKRAADLLETQVKERTAELARSNSELEKFAYVASHDLQEPLRKVQAFGDRLAKRFAPGLGTDGKDYIERMQQSAARMQTLIQDLLTFSRVSTKPRAFVPVPLGPLVDGVLSDLEALTTRTGATVQVGDLPTVFGDPGQLRQVFQNLVANACKFHKPGQPPTVTLTATRLEGLPDAADPPPGLPAGWRLTVSDDGIGFEQQYADKIFEVFQRLHGRGTYEGTGIGLAICRKVVERHGGIITARGRPGEGAVFAVDLPALPGDPAP